MLASQHPVRSRVLQVSTMRALGHAPALSALVIGATSTRRLPRQLASLPAVSRRNFWGGRNSSRHWATLLGVHNYHRNCKTRYDVTKEKGPRPPYQNYASNWDHPLNQYRPSQGWRLSSSWGKPGGRWVIPDFTSVDKSKIGERDAEWKHEYTKRQAAIAHRLELFKKQIEKDPFGMLFGNAVERSINPWIPLQWFLAGKEGKDGAASREMPTKSPSPDSAGAKPTAHTSRSGETLGEASAKERQVGGTPTTQTTSGQHIRDVKESEPSVNTANNRIIVEDYEIDPITLRKVHKIHEESPPVGTKATFDAAVDVPVKTFKDGTSRSFLLDRQNDALFTDKQTPIKPSDQDKTSTRSEPDIKPSSARTMEKTWLAQEGFGEGPIVVSNQRAMQISDSAETETSSPANANTRRLENSLDRHWRNAVFSNKPTNCIKKSAKPLEYKIEENKAEDIDLLRASDVRASYGHVAKSGTETDAEKQSRRQKIEDDYQERRQHLDIQYTKELAAEEAGTASAIAKRPDAQIGQEMKTQDLEASFLNKISIQEPSTAGGEPNPSLRSVQSPDTSYQRAMEARVQKEENLYARELEVASTQIQPDEKLEVARKEMQPNKNGSVDSMKAQLVGAETKCNKTPKRSTKYTPEALLLIGNKLLSSLTRDRKQEAAEQAHAEEVKRQHSVMAAFEDGNMRNTSQTTPPVQGVHQGEGDMPATLHRFLGRHRSYKNKAPHAVKDQAKILRDRDLIREITGIYEDIYGTIDTKHRQVRESSAEKKPELAAAQGKKQYKKEPSKDKNKPSSVPNRQEAVAITTSPNDAIAKPVSKAQAAIEVPSNSTSSAATKSGRRLPTPQTDSGLSQTAPRLVWAQILQALGNKSPKKAKQQAKKNGQLQSWLRAAIKSQDLLDARDRRKGPSLDLPKAAKRVSNDATVPAEGHKNAVSTSPSASTSVVAPAPSSPVPPTLYKILAHDPSTGEIAIASATSALASPSSPPLSISEALMRLTSPARFLPHFATLRQSGYEIVSGNGDVLVFKKVRDAASSAANNKNTTISNTIMPAKTKTAKRGAISTSNAFTSRPHPPATATHHPAIHPPHAADSTPSSPPVRRQEAVFSGSPRWRYGRDQESNHSQRDTEEGTGPQESFGQRARAVGKRVLWVGVWMAGCCYAVGVVAEVVMPRGGGMG